MANLPHSIHEFMTIDQLCYPQDKLSLLSDISSVLLGRKLCSSVGYSARSNGISDRMSKDNLDEYQPLLVKDFTDRKQTKVCRL